MILNPDLNKLKLLDFGVGKLVCKKDRMLRQHTMCTGTNRYMAPEVFFGADRPYTEKADIYSAALVIWEIATGRKPFEANGEEDIHDLCWAVLWECGGNAACLTPAGPQKRCSKLQSK